MEEPPEYQQIAEKALHLNQLGLSNEAIARQLGVDGKTVAIAAAEILIEAAASRHPSHLSSPPKDTV
ncbi:MAG: hypothetical protein PHD74_04985 [Candidatus Krumholzibacteria bacterium]|nr:hypothetical protein [Candidatus Krumholzibacteria bacterium]